MSAFMQDCEKEPSDKCRTSTNQKTSVYICIYVVTCKFNSKFKGYRVGFKGLCLRKPSALKNQETKTKNGSKKTCELFIHAAIQAKTVFFNTKPNNLYF